MDFSLSEYSDTERAPSNTKRARLREAAGIIHHQHTLPSVEFHIHLRWLGTTVRMLNLVSFLLKLPLLLFDPLSSSLSTLNCSAAYAFPRRGLFLRAFTKLPVNPSLLNRR